MIDTAWIRAEVEKQDDGPRHPITMATEDVYEILSEIDRLREEVDRLGRSNVRYQYALVTDPMRPIEAEDYDSALALLRLPGRENDGGPGNLTEDIRDILHNHEVEREGWDREVERLRARLRMLAYFIVPMCQALHHRHEDEHTGDQSCPVVERVRAALTDAGEERK